MNENIKEKLILLIRLAMGAGTEDVPNISESVAAGIYKLAKMHDVGHLAAYAITRYSLLDGKSEIADRLNQVYLKAIRRCARQKYVLERLGEIFENAGVDYIPLKGSVLREYYPEDWMRTGSDIDILVKKADYKKAAELIAAGIKCESRGVDGYHSGFVTEKNVVIELHEALMDEHEYEAADVLDEIWESAEPVDGAKHHLKMRDDWYYYHHILHMLMHFETGGCGLRFLLDLWVLNRMDITDGQREARRQRLQDAGLLAFADGAGELASCMFDGREITNGELLTMREFILSGGAYGSTEQRVAYQRQKSGGRAGYLLSRVFIPYERLKLTYPVLEKHPVLTPLYEVVRWFRLVFRPGQSRTKNEIKASGNTDGFYSDESIKNMRNYLGI